MNNKETDSCEIYCYDQLKVQKLQRLLEGQNIQGMVKMFKVLADETRMKIAIALCAEDELCVCDVANIIGCSLATASHHLRSLKQMGLAKYRKAGKLVFYSLEDDHVQPFVHLASIHSRELITNQK